MLGDKPWDTSSPAALINIKKLVESFNLGGKVSGAIAVPVVKTLLNGWTTEHRMQHRVRRGVCVREVQREEIAPGQGECITDCVHIDSLKHYLFCPEFYCKVCADFVKIGGVFPISVPSVGSKRGVLPRSSIPFQEAVLNNKFFDTIYAALSPGLPPEYEHTVFESMIRGSPELIVAAFKFYHESHGNL